ncbi:hypothetical protein F5Y13DRAFT_91004 [Hypoxylon sp. FL1857]|nr:hypothetical protein F5Y13DRAFT_91004 [Hypoxylon sp. FL1857]
MESVELHDIGINVFKAFGELLTPDDSNEFPGHRHLTNEEQRFRLWAHSLGLRQKGHASLDYRVRDATIVKTRLAQVLLKLQEHLDSLLAIAKGERRPFEQDADIDEDSDDEDSTGSDGESQANEQSSSRSQSSFHEVDFRLQSLSESLDSLYGLATRIRNPRNRPQRPNDQLYKYVPAKIRASYIKAREEAEITIIAYAQRQQLIEMMPHEATGLAPSSEELINQYATVSHWLIRRTGIANARRRQQFAYWKGHALRLSQDPQNTPTALAPEQPNRDPHESQTVQGMQAAIDAAPSLATSATELPLDLMKPGDIDSVISHQSRLSTVMDLKGEKLEWPAPPTQITSGPYFTCPYCRVLCPQRYRTKDAWRVHLIHDLQPYHCTYEDCQDPYWLYETRQDWIDHESLHSRVWHCQTHSEEFETQPDYVEHLKTSHPEASPEHFSPELIASVVGASLKTYRDCPFCPTTFPGAPDMERHIMFHLERCALLSLPFVGDGSDRDGSDHPSDSHEVQHHGRQGSVALDFDSQGRESFIISIAKLNTGSFDSEIVESQEAVPPEPSRLEPKYGYDEYGGHGYDEYDMYDLDFSGETRRDVSEQGGGQITETNLEHIDTWLGTDRLKLWLQSQCDSGTSTWHEAAVKQDYNDPWKLRNYLTGLFGQGGYRVRVKPQCSYSQSKLSSTDISTI